MYNLHKRGYQRYPCNIYVTILTDHGDFCGLVKNIGMGGMLLTAEQLKIDINSKVKLRFKLPTMISNIEVDANIRWSKDNVFGVQFDKTFDSNILVEFFEIFSF